MAQERLTSNAMKGVQELAHFADSAIPMMDHGVLSKEWLDAVQKHVADESWAILPSVVELSLQSVSAANGCKIDEVSNTCFLCFGEMKKSEMN